MSEAIPLLDLIGPTRKQRRFIELLLNVKFLFYGGARGGGKSYILRWAAVFLLVYWAKRGHRNVRVGIFCETFKALHDRQLARARTEFPDWLGKWNLAEHEFTLHSQYGGGVICFRNLDDPDKYLSAEFAAQFVDELTRNGIEVFNALRGSRRWPGIAHCPFAAASNPGGVGHTWVKDVWIDRSFILDETKNLIAAARPGKPQPYTQDDFVYLPATVSDNPHLADDYLRELESLPDRLRAAFVDGNWDVFEGQAFAWNRDYHEIGQRKPPKGWRYVGGLDWGHRKGWYGVVAISPEHDYELVFEHVLQQTYAKEAAMTVVSRYQLTGLPDPEYVAYDNQMDQDHGVKAGLTIFQEWCAGWYQAHGSPDEAPGLIAAAKGRGSRAIKFDLMTKVLDYQENKDPETGELRPWNRPRFRAQKQCAYAIATIKSLPIAETGDDVDTESDDHAYDGIGNILISNPPPAEKALPFVHQDKHPGFTKSGRRPKYEEDQIAARGNAFVPTGYQMPRAHQMEHVGGEE